MIESALVTGATGFIGSRLVKRLDSMGTPTIALVRAASAEAAVRLRSNHVQTVPYRSNDDLSDALKQFRAETVFHLAAAGVRSATTATDVVEGNVNLMMRLLTAVADWPLKRFLYTGSCSEYGIPIGNGPLTETTALQPSSVYGAAKASAFLTGRTLAAQHNVPFTNLRLFGVYGLGEASTRLIPYIIRSLADNQPAKLTGGQQIRDFLFVDDVIDALLSAADCDSLGRNDVYNIASGIGTPICDVARTVAQVMGKPESLLRFGDVNYRTDEPMSLIGCSQRFQECTDWKPATTLTAGIQRMVELYNQQRSAA